MPGHFVEVQDRDLLGDRADETFAHCELGHVDRALVEPERREQLEAPSRRR
jgi:hypothetical protein